MIEFKGTEWSKIYERVKRELTGDLLRLADELKIDAGLMMDSNSIVESIESISEKFAELKNFKKGGVG